MEKITKKNSIIYNQLWVIKAIEEGHINFLPVHKLPNKSIGEHIEIKYNQLYNNEFEKNYNNGTLAEYYHLIEETPKVTQKDSLLFTREWIEKYKEEGLSIPTRALDRTHSLGEILAIQYYSLNLNKRIKQKEQPVILPGKRYIRKK